MCYYVCIESIEHMSDTFMKIVSILNQKGGVGKTTLTINIAKALELRGYGVLMVDTDPQASLTQWKSLDKGDVCAPVLQVTEGSISKAIAKYSSDSVDWVIIDSHSKITKAAQETIFCSDIILIPLGASPFDLWACTASIHLIQEIKIERESKPVTAFVFNAIRSGTKLIDKVRANNNFPFQVFNNSTGMRQVYPESVEAGLTVFDMENKLAQDEINGITSELMEIANVIN